MLEACRWTIGRGPYCSKGSELVFEARGKLDMSQITTARCAPSGTVEKDSAQMKILDECEISGAGILRCYLAATAPPFYAYEHVEGVPIYDSYVSQVSQVCLITQT